MARPKPIRVGDPAALTARPVEELSPTQFSLGAPVAPDVVANNVATIPPRPAGASTAPRPQSIAERDTEIRSFVTDPQAEKLRLLREAKTVRQRSAVEAQFGEETPAAARGREAAEVRRAADVAGKVAIAGAPAVATARGTQAVATINAASADLKSRLQAKADAGEQAVDLLGVTTEASTAEKQLKNQLDIAIRGNDAAERRALIDSQTDTLVEQIRQSKAPTPLQTASIKRIEGIEKNRNVILTGIADIQSQIPEANRAQRAALETLQASLTGMLDDLDGQQEEALGAVSEQPLAVTEGAVVDAPAGTVTAEDTTVAPAGDALDINGDGEATPEEGEFNQISTLLKERKGDLTPVQTERLNKRKKELAIQIGL